MGNLLEGFLADTWWYGLTSRLSDSDLQRLAQRRVKQGFNAVQIVFGIPPEATPENPNAFSPSGPAWYKDGTFNAAYMEFARQRIQYLNSIGLMVVVYGAWGNQIGWLGIGRMLDWWSKILNTTSDLNVVYCLTGESNLNPNTADENLFDKFSPNLPGMSDLDQSHSFYGFFRNKLNRRCYQIQYRRRAWSIILDHVARNTEKPVLIHPLPHETGFDVVENPDLLAANTAQSGHSQSSRPRLLELPLNHFSLKDPAGRGFINLEPWYEGILNKFWLNDQLYAYWVCMLAGASSYCYGAQGIWNVGDGEYLNHWGSQTFEHALSLDTPGLIGLSHQLYLHTMHPLGEVLPEVRGNRIISLTRKFPETAITYIPEINDSMEIPAGTIWLPLEGSFSAALPMKGQVVIISGKNNDAGVSI
jgi:hypothetical protein